MGVLEMSCLRLIRRVTVGDSMRSEDIKIGCGLKYKTSERVVQSLDGRDSRGEAGELKL